MKVIGLMATWNNIEFFKYSVKQALNFCDELILVEGCHSMKYPKRSTDGTCEYIKAMKGSPKLIIRDFNRGDRYDRVQRQIRQNFSRESALYEPDNWIIAWDDDIFFFDKDLIRLRTAMETAKRDMLFIRERQFIYNFKFNSCMSFGRCYRIVDGSYITSISTPRYSNGERFQKEELEGVEIFHYNYVKKPERFRARMVMSAEKGTRESAKRYEQFMSVVWDKDEDIFKSRSIVESIRPGEGLNIYNGEHPEAVSNHSWHYIKDIREAK